MAQNATWTRRINLFINGKEVKNDVKSIKGEMQKLIAAQSRMTIGSREYNEQTKKIQMLNGILKKHRAELYQTQQGWGGLNNAASKFNKYFGILSAGIATLTGVGFGFRKAADAADLFEERLDNLSALTGLEGKELEWLGEQAKISSTKVTEAGIKIKQSATDILDAYTKVGSQRPELLKNKEALAEVTENAIILSEAAKGKLEPAVEALTNTMNQFNLNASDSRRVINALAAGSKEGAADIPYLSQAIEKMGTTFSLMGGEVEQGIGMIEAVAPKFKKAEVAGNSLDKVLLKMKAEQIGYNNGVFDLNLALLELEKRYKAGESATDIFGVEHAKMAEVLVMSRSEIERYTQAVTDTSIAEEQARKNTNNRAADLAQARNEVTKITIELGEKLSPVLTKATYGFAAFLGIIKELPRIIRENQTLLIALTGAVVAYNARLIQATAAQAAKIAMDLHEKAVSAAVIAISTAKVLAMKAYIAITGKATASQLRFREVQKAFGGAMALNPLGAAIAAITALYLAIKTYDKYNGDAMRREKERQTQVQNLTEANESLGEAYEKIRTQVGSLNTLSVERRDALLEETKATINLTKEELEQAKHRRDSLFNASKQLSTFQTIWHYMKKGMVMQAHSKDLDSMEKGLAQIAEQANKLKEENATEAVAEIDKQIGKLQDRLTALNQEGNKLSDILNAEKLGDKIGTETLANLEEKLSKYQLALKHAARGGEDYIRIQKKINQVQKEMDKYAPDVVNDDNEKKKQKELEKQIAAKKSAEKKLADFIKKTRRKLRMSEVSEEEQALQAIDNKYADVYNNLKKYVESGEIDITTLIELQEEERQTIIDKYEDKRIQKQLEVQAELESMYLSDFEKEKQEKIKHLQEMMKLAEDNGLMDIEAYQMMQDELKAIRDSEEPRDMFGMTPEDREEFLNDFDRAMQYVDQIGAAWGSVNAIMANQNKKELQQYEKGVKRKKDKLNDQLENGLISQEQYNAKVAKLDADLDKKKTELAIKQAKREKALGIFEATVNTAKEVTKVLAQPWLAALVAASGALQIAAIATQPLPEYKDGGYNGYTKGDGIYTSSSGQPFRAGENGKKEWIGSNKMVTDPYTGPVIAALEAIQRGKAPASIFGGVTPAFAEMQAIPGYKQGGYNGSSSNSTVNNYYGNANIDALIGRMDLLIEENRQLRMYLSDPQNRQAYITNHELDKNTRENKERVSLGRIG